MTRFICIALLAALTWPLEAVAHSLLLDVAAEGATLRGSARFSDRTPVAGERVNVFTPLDATVPIASTLTGDDGRFTFEGQAATTYRVVIEAEEGHSGERVVTTGAGVATGRALTREDLDRALIPLREDVARLTRQWRLSDLAGVVGVAVGVFGIVVWLRSKK